MKPRGQNKSYSSIGQNDASQRRFLTAPQVCARYKKSNMSLHRWLHDDELGFPKPAMHINSRRLWLESDLLAWEDSRIAR